MSSAVARHHGSHRIVGPDEVVRATVDHHQCGSLAGLEEQVVNGSIAHLTTEYDVHAIQILGHTGCSVIGDAYEPHIASEREISPGIEARLEPLISLVSDAFDAGVVDSSVSPRATQYRLVEYNVVRQVESLRDRLRAPVPVVGYVHDQDGAHGSFPQKHYLVSVDGETNLDAIQAARGPSRFPSRVSSHTPPPQEVLSNTIMNHNVLRKSVREHFV